jgi:hypothetical protein
MGRSQFALPTIDPPMQWFFTAPLLKALRLQFVMEFNQDKTRTYEDLMNYSDNLNCLQGITPPNNTN